MSNKTVIIDYGMGNLYSVFKKLKKLNAEVFVGNTTDSINKADKIILPGVGHFGKAMNQLYKLNIIDTLNTAVLIHKKPILGICLGMQLMTKRSEEGNLNGFGWFDAEVIKFNISEVYKFKVPHIGWNNIKINKKSKLMTGISDSDKFYFVHSYHVITKSKDILNTTDYEYTFVSALEKNNIFGVQYHPEKSHDIGDTLFRNFIDL